MARRCDISNKGTRSGNNVSHSHLKTKRKFKANIQTKRFYIVEKKIWIKINVSTRVLRTIQKKGLMATLKKYGASLEQK